MHTYSIDTNARYKVNYIIIFLSFVLSYVLKNYINELSFINVKNEILLNIISYSKDWGIVPNILGMTFIYGTLSYLYNNYLWKMFTNIHKIPNLNGTWCGKLTSSFNNGTELDMKIVIKQTWDRISFVSYFNNSSSYSISSSICVKSIGGLRIDFSYVNETYEINIDSMISTGYNYFQLIDNNLKGHYFSRKTDIARNVNGTYGTISLIKEKNNILNKLKNISKK